MVYKEMIFFEATRYFTDFPSFDGAKSARLLNAWSPTNTSSLIPSAYAGASDLEFASSSYLYSERKFFKVKKYTSWLLHSHG